MNGFARALGEWTPPDPVQERLRREYLRFALAHGDDSFRRDAQADHVTASCFVFTPDFGQLLLCFHRKGRFWVQLGGHIEPSDASVADAALREAREEGGIEGVRLVSHTPGDLDRHSLSSAFGRCSTHWDVGFVGVAPADSVPVTSAESEDVRWFDVTALPDDVPPGLAGRVATVLASVRSA